MIANIKGNDSERGKTFLRHEYYGIHEGQYGQWKVDKKDKTSRFVACGSAVYVKKVLINLEDMKKSLVLEFYDYSGNCIEIMMNRSEMTEQNILTLVSYGVQVEKRTANTLIKCIENEETKAPVTYQHQHTGFSVYNGEDIFKGFKALKIESQYIGGLELKPRGSWKKWTKMVKEEVLGTAMEVVLATALSATVIDYIHNEYPVDNILMSLVGNSSSGKTTALNLAVSTGALPATGKKSLMLSFVDTELSIVHRIPSAFPVGIDEYSALEKNITKLLYTLANGSERNRMTKDLNMADTRDFHTAIFMSGECSVLSSACKYEGLRVRVMEFYDVKWTSSGESADVIKKVCLSNYGWAVPKLAKYLLEIDKESLIDVCEEYSRNYLKNRTDCDALANRMAKKVGIILATAQIAEEALGLQFDLDMIEEFFRDNIMAEPEEYDIGIKAYKAVISYYVEKPLEFGDLIRDVTKTVLEEPEIYYKSGKVMSAREKRLYDGTVSNSILFITEHKFNKILEDNKFKDSRVILRRLRELDLLVSDSDRLKSKAKLGAGKITVTGYKLRLPEGLLGRTEKSKGKTKKK